jgi:hypothetical protein
VQVQKQKLGLLLRALQRVAVRAAQEARVLRPERSGKLPRERSRRRRGVLRLRAAGSELEEARAARPVAQQRRGHEPEHRMNDLCKSTRRRLPRERRQTAAARNGSACAAHRQPKVEHAAHDSAKQTEQAAAGKRRRRCGLRCSGAARQIICYRRVHVAVVRAQDGATQLQVLRLHDFRKVTRRLLAHACARRRDNGGQGGATTARGVRGTGKSKENVAGRGNVSGDSCAAPRPAAKRHDSLGTFAQGTTACQ